MLQGPQNWYPPMFLTQSFFWSQTFLTPQKLNRPTIQPTTAISELFIRAAWNAQGLRVTCLDAILTEE